MTGPCRFAGQPCPRPAVATARIAMVGDRALCQTHIDWLTAQGMAYRLLSPDAVVPEWKQRGLRKVLDHGRSAA